MLYGIKIATRYLTANRAQSLLLVLGVAVGVYVFVFMSALIGGLAVLLIDRTVGSIAHVVVEPAGGGGGRVEGERRAVECDLV